MEENGIRINKFLSEAGVCSRREADRQVELGNITIDGKVAETGARVLPGQTVLFQGKKVSKEEEMILIAFHKPVGIVCTAEKREKNNVIDYINYPKRIYPIGRLDKDSEGLLLIKIHS
jgi:23S rRNA pseudouridine2604 synthase